MRCLRSSALPSDDVALFVVLQARRRPPVEAHAEHQPVALQHLLDLGEGLLAEVRRAQQLDLGGLHHVADVVNVLGLEAVGAAHGELELVHRTQQYRIELHLRDLGRRLFLALQVDEHRQLVLQDAAGAAAHLPGLHGSVGPDFRFSRTSTTSSCTPSMLVYSCSTPSISTSVIALPGIDDSSTRRSAFPSVWPKPRSNGSITTRAWRGATGCTFTTRGLRNSLTEPCIACHLAGSFATGTKRTLDGLKWVL